MKKRTLAILLVIGMLFISTGTAFARGGYGGRHYYGGHRGGISWGGAAKVALLTAGIGVVVDAARGMPLWYDPYAPVIMVPRQPMCGWEPSVVFDAYRQPVGTMSVWRCY